MSPLLFISALQNLATGAFIASCVDSETLLSNWPAAAFLTLCNLIFVRYLVTEKCEGNRATTVGRQPSKQIAPPRGKPSFKVRRGDRPRKGM